MKKLIVLISALLVILALAACAAQPTVSVSDVMSAVAGTQTAMVSSPATAMAASSPVASQAAAPTATSLSASSITITSVKDQGSGNILVSWDATGNFPSGFELVWSSSNQTPTYPTDTGVAVTDPSARSATFQGSIDNIYFVRVCSLSNNSCDVYSNVGYVAVFAPTAAATTPAMTPTAVSKYIAPTPVPANPKIYIYKIAATGYGAAVIYWTASGSFPNGFYILYARNNTSLVYGEASAYRVPDGSYRVFTVTGEVGQTYYYKICRFTGTSCDADSNIFSFKMASSK